jgi:uncharacterized protein YjbI with pentapeptide repeats
MTGSVMIGVDLSGANMTGAIVTGMVVDLTAIDSTTAKQISELGGTVEPYVATVDGDRFLQAIADHEKWIDSGGASGRRLDFNQIKIPLIKVSNRNLAGCRLRRCRIDGGDWTGINFSMADLSYTSMPGIRLDGGDLRGTNLRKANLSEASLVKTNFAPLPLASGSRLWPANLDGAILRGANLTHASLNGAILRNANLKGCVLEGTSFRGADLEGAWR